MTEGESRPLVSATIDDLERLARTGSLADCLIVGRELPFRRSRRARDSRDGIIQLLLAAAKREKQANTSQFSSMSEQALRSKWIETVRWISRLRVSGQEHKAGDLQLRLRAIEGEWSARQKSDPSRVPAWWGRTGSTVGVTAAGIWQTGMLSHLGYRVGARGLEPVERRYLLNFIEDSVLPPLNSPEYLGAWGEPGSLQRREKMIYTLKCLAGAARSRRGHELAAHDWASDADYLKRNSK